MKVKVDIKINIEVKVKNNMDQVNIKARFWSRSMYMVSILWGLPLSKCIINQLSN